MDFFDNLLLILETLSDGMGNFFDSFTLTFSDVLSGILESFPWVGQILADLLDNSWLGDQSFMFLTIGVGVSAIAVIKVVKGIFL